MIVSIMFHASQEEEFANVGHEWFRGPEQAGRRLFERREVNDLRYCHLSLPSLQRGYSATLRTAPAGRVLALVR